MRGRAGRDGEVSRWQKRPNGARAGKAGRIQGATVSKREGVGTSTVQPWFNRGSTEWGTGGATESQLSVSVSVSVSYLQYLYRFQLRRFSTGTFAQSGESPAEGGNRNR